MSDPDLSSFRLERQPTGLFTASLAPEAYCGLAGDFVRMLEPHTEADPVAILAQTLGATGNLIGPGPHFRVEADSHPLNEFMAIVGDSSKSRKGTSWGHVRRLLSAVDPQWSGECVQSGLASGEGLICAVSNEASDGERKTRDRRLCVLEPEFARVLKICERRNETLSPIMRQAWDSGDLRVLTRNRPLCATGAYISIVAHITREELRRLLTETQAANGFANRFIWVFAQRAQLLPEGGKFHLVDLRPIVARFKEAVRFARGVGELRRDDEATELWRAVYPDLSAGKPGLFGSVTSRAEAHVMRVASIYAVLDSSVAIRHEHLTAPLALWRYCERSAAYIFGQVSGNSVADKILEAIRLSPGGLTMTEIRQRLNNHVAKEEMSQAIDQLAVQGKVQLERVETGGRPRHVIRAQKAQEARKAPQATLGALSTRTGD